jgi:hypothetical protein
MSNDEVDGDGNEKPGFFKKPGFWGGWRGLEGTSGTQRRLRIE